MYARLARFEGDPGSLDRMIEQIRTQLESGETPPGLEAVQRVLVLVDRDSGRSTSLVFCATEDELRTIDEALNQMAPGGDTRRTGVELLEVAIDRSSS